MKDKLLPPFQRLSKVLYSQRVLLSVFLGALCLAYVILGTGSHISTGRDEARFEEGLTSLKKFKFDDKAIEQIRALKGEDINVNSNITNSRTNPFNQ